MAAMKGERDELQADHNALRGDHVTLTKKSNALDAMVTHMRDQIQRNETHVEHLKQLYNSCVPQAPLAATTRAARHIRLCHLNSASRATAVPAD